MTSVFWRYGFWIHLSLVSAIAIAAYLGILPASYAVIPCYDIIAHFVLVGILSFFFDGVLQFRPLFQRKYPFITLAPTCLIVFAALEECAQSLSSLRTASMYDFIADFFGIVAGAALARFVAMKTDDRASVCSEASSR